MTDPHPLTDKLAEDIALDVYELETAWSGKEIVFTHDDMRRAADWQLERCAEELNEILYYFQLVGKLDEAGRKNLVNIFKESMRPQEEL